LEESFEGKPGRKEKKFTPSLAHLMKREEQITELPLEEKRHWEKGEKSASSRGEGEKKIEIPKGKLEKKD